MPLLNTKGRGNQNYACPGRIFMKILVLGGNGMAGHVIKEYLGKSHDVYCTLRKYIPDQRAVYLDLSDEIVTYSTLQIIKPDIVINAAGILNQDAAERIEDAIAINSLLPHKLDSWGNRFGFRLIHMSTNCVFSGLKGNYVEDDVKDGDTVYGITKNLGEVLSDKHVTIRISIIGPEIRNNGIGLFHWFMNQSGSIQGNQQTLWNGVTTLELAKAIEWVIQHDISGLVHLAGTKTISNYYLLLLLKKVFNKDIDIIPSSNERVDKTLVNTREDFVYQTQDYESMIKEMKEWMEKHRKLYAHYTFK